MPCEAAEVSVVKAIIGLPVARTTRDTSRTSGANTGPITSSTPSPIAAWAAARAPSGVE